MKNFFAQSKQKIKILVSTIENLPSLNKNTQFNYAYLHSGIRRHGLADAAAGARAHGAKSAPGLLVPHPVLPLSPSAAGQPWQQIRAELDGSPSSAASALQDDVA